MKHYANGDCDDCEGKDGKKSLGTKKPNKGKSPQAPPKKTFPKIKGTMRGKDY